MDLIEISKAIQEKIIEIDKIKSVIKKRGEEKALANAVYEKQLSITIVKLKNGIEFNVDGELISNPPATIIEKIARGICYNEKMESDKAEAFYKSAIVNLEATMSQMNALQSLSKYLE